jgi:hypothetical protein
MAAKEDYVRVRDLHDAYLVCRAIGHSWDDNPHGEVDSEFFRMCKGVLMLRCTRCTTERYDYIDYSNEVFQRYYKYPQDYRRVEPGTHRPDLRGEMMRRSLLIEARRRRNGKK